MATGRTLQKHFRVYGNGYDLSGFARSVGPFGLTYDEADLTVWTDSVKGYLRGQPQSDLGTFNAVFDNTATTGIHALMGTAGTIRNMLIAMGIRGAPAAGDPCFGGQFDQSAYQTADDGGALTVTIPFAGVNSAATTLIYPAMFGQIVHANGAETAANTGAGIDNYTGGATTTGGYMLYHVLASSNASHTATISIDDSANNSTFAALSGATTGSITVTAGVSGVVALGNTATVRQYLRWQLALGTATSVTFISAFIRG